MEARSLLFVLLLAFLACSSSVHGYGVQTHHPHALRYDGHAVYQVNLANEAQGHRFTKLFLSLEALLGNTERETIKDQLVLDIWPDYNIKIGPNIVNVNLPSEFEQRLKLMNISYSVIIPDLQKMIDREKLELLEVKERESLRSTHSLDDFFSTYRTYSDFVEWMDSLVTNYPNLVTSVNLGKTVEGNDILGMKITSTSNTKAPKPGIFYNGCQHAREWISPMTVAYIAYQLITGYGNSQTVTNMVDQFEWTIVPITNVDGYLWTQTTRLWRKNRRVNANSTCKGVDINRNWSYKWNTGGSSNAPCSDIYLGPSPFSEPENKALADWVGAHSNIVGYIDFHSYSQLYMTPWGWSTNLPADYNDQIALANEAVAAMGAVNGVQYEAGSVANIIYIASGGSLDWTYGASGVKYSFAIELRDTGQYGFLLPASQIVPQGQEAFAGVVAMAQYIQQNNN